MRFKALHDNNQGADKCVAFVVVVVIFVADASPSFSPATVTTPHIQGECTKVFRYPIEDNSAATLFDVLLQYLLDAV